MRGSPPIPSKNHVNGYAQAGPTWTTVHTGNPGRYGEGYGAASAGRLVCSLAASCWFESLTRISTLSLSSQDENPVLADLGMSVKTAHFLWAYMVQVPHGIAREALSASPLADRAGTQLSFIRTVSTSSILCVGTGSNMDKVTTPPKRFHVPRFACVLVKRNTRQPGICRSARHLLWGQDERGSIPRFPTTSGRSILRT